MDAGGLTLIQRLIALGKRSLLQYVSDAAPFTNEKSRDLCAAIFVAAAEERDAIASLLRVLQKQHIRPVVVGSYPAQFTLLNFVTIDSLAPKLSAEIELHLSELEKRLAATDDEETRGLVEPFLAMKRRHLQMLQSPSAT